MFLTAGRHAPTVWRLAGSGSATPPPVSATAGRQLHYQVRSRGRHGQAWYSTGTTADAPVTVTTASPAGGWVSPQGRRKTRKEVHAERVRLGILPPDIVKAAKAVAEKAAEQGDPAEVYREKRDSLNAKFMQELHITHWLPDYTRAIQAQIALIEQEEEDILLLL